MCEMDEFDEEIRRGAEEWHQGQEGRIWQEGNKGKLLTIKYNIQIQRQNQRQENCQ